MNFSLLVKVAPFAHQGSLTAYRFCIAALSSGHCILQVFFYQDGVYNASSLNTPAGDEIDLPMLWAELAKIHGIELSLCSASAVRRGILDAAYAEQFEKTAHNLLAPFKIASLTRFFEVASQNRLVVFES